MRNYKKRLLYAAAFALLLGIEIIIALYVHDTFVRPYLGDVLAVMCLYCLARTAFPEKPAFMSAVVTALAFVVELLQLTELSELVGKDTVPGVILGAVFDPGDLACYTIGGVIAAAWDIFLVYSRKNKSGKA